MNEKPNYYAIIPADVRYDKDLKAIEKLLYGEITTLTHQTGECWASNNYFANLYDVYPTTISKYINHLKDKGYIQIRMDYVGNSKEIEKRIICIAQTDNTYCSNKQEGIVRTSKGGIVQTSKENNTSKLSNTSINNKEIYKERFEEFYQAYPKHLKKAEVEKWFYKNKPDETLFKTIMTQLEKFKQCKEWKQQQYIPYPSTWLNQKRWEDEIKTQEDIDKEILDYLKEMNPDETE